MTAAPTPLADDQVAPGIGAQVRGLLGLAVPLIGSNLAGFAIHMTDVLLIGRFTTVTDLAAITISSSLQFVLFLLGSGPAIALMGLVAAAAAKGDPREVRRLTRMALWLGLMFCALAIPILLQGEWLLGWLGQPADVARQGGVYLGIVAFALPPMVVIAVLRSFLAGLEATRVLFWVTLAGVAFNGLAGYAAIVGHFGLPPMGLRGAAWVAVLTNVVMALALAGYAAWRFPAYELFVRFWRPDWAAMGRVFRLGWPISLALLAETGLFSASSVMMGQLGEVPLAAHGVALQLASLTFMLHLGLSQAGTVRAGRAYGLGDRDGAWVVTRAAAVLSLGFAAVTILAFLTIPQTLAQAFVGERDPRAPEVVALAIRLLAFAALFQLFDGLQVLAMGLLRGVQDTRVPMVAAAVSYWVVGAPLAWALSGSYGADGIWLGLTVGLGLAAGLLAWRLRGRLARVGRT